MDIYGGIKKRDVYQDRLYRNDVASSDYIFRVNNVNFYLPYYPNDFISRIIVNEQRYWDIWGLTCTNPYIPDNANIIDVGANIGNHTIYWALERNANKIYCFEPLPEAFKILSKNIELNFLNDRVQLYNVGLSNECCNGSVLDFSVGNVGSTTFRKDSNGKISFKTLDSFDFPEKIHLLKIDVEGAEMDVLCGAKNTILKHKPVISIESFNHKDELNNFMESLSYEMVRVVRDEDFIYVHKENIL